MHAVDWGIRPFPETHFKYVCCQNVQLVCLTAFGSVHLHGSFLFVNEMSERKKNEILNTQINKHNRHWGRYCIRANEQSDDAHCQNMFRPCKMWFVWCFWCGAFDRCVCVCFNHFCYSIFRTFCKFKCGSLGVCAG